MNKQKFVGEQDEWALVASELQAENLKLASYDNTLIPKLGNVKGKRVLDYGCGPGVLALALQKLGADVKAFDISPDMLKLAGQKIGFDNVFAKFEDIPKNNFDIIICNLVLCIVPESEVKIISNNIRSLLNDDGCAYIGFCNPRIFNVLESNLDLRFPTGSKYEENHNYKKIKKEGGYEIIETHRPVEWYSDIFSSSGLNVSDTLFTPRYELKGNQIEDFIIFKLLANQGEEE